MTVYGKGNSRSNPGRLRISQHDMDSTDIDRVMQTLPPEEPFTERVPKPLFGSMEENLKRLNTAIL